MTRAGLVLIALVLTAAGVRGHHSHSDFALDRETTVAGTIAGIRFQNPHVLIMVRTAGSMLYTAEWQGAQWLESHPELVSPPGSAVTSVTLKPGDHIVVVGSPPRDSALHSIVNLREVRRPRDGWLWTCRHPGAPHGC